MRITVVESNNVVEFPKKKIEINPTLKRKKRRVPLLIIENLLMNQINVRTINKINWTRNDFDLRNEFDLRHLFDLFFFSINKLNLITNLCPLEGFFLN